MDIANLTFLSLIGIGTVNVLSFFKPNLDSRLKIAACFVVVFAVSFIPVDIGNMILNHAKAALEVTLAGSGLYKIAQKSGGE